jgi:distribution and morphology protein 34
MLLRLGNFRLSSYVVLVLSKQKGITLVFKTDPLQNVEVSSTFDSIAVIQKFIQREIEEQLREMFREDLPSIIHRLSQRWIAERTVVEAPYLHQMIGRTQGSTGTVGSPTLVPQNSPMMHKVRLPQAQVGGFTTHSTLAMPALGIPTGLRPHYLLPRPGQFRFPPQSAVSTPIYLPRQAGTPGSAPAECSLGRSPSTRSAPPTKSYYSSNEEVSFPDIENFDPTYGLRDEALPTKSDYEAFSRLFIQGSRGLADLASERETELDFGDGESAFDYVEWEESMSASVGGGSYKTSPNSMFDLGVDEVLPELESIPAVGGGTITRPRIYHSQSAIKNPLAPSTSPAASLSGASTSTYIRRSSSVSGSSQSAPLEVKSSWRGRPMFSINEASEGEEDKYNPYFGEAPDTLHSLDTASRPRVGRLQSQSIVGSSTQASSQASSRLSMNSTPLTSPPSSFEMGTSPPKLPASSHRNVDRPRSLSPFKRDRGFVLGSPSAESNFEDHQDDEIVVRNNTASQLSALSHSNQTLSPYTRSLSHFTIRSVPPRPVQAKPPNGAVRGRRKRIYRLGSTKPPQDAAAAAAAEEVEDHLEQKLRNPSSPPPPSEFSDEDVDHYFRHAHASPRLGMEAAIRRRAPYANSNV